MDRRNGVADHARRLIYGPGEGARPGQTSYALLDSLVDDLERCYQDALIGCDPVQFLLWQFATPAQGIWRVGKLQLQVSRGQPHHFLEKHDLVFG